MPRPAPLLVAALLLPAAPQARAGLYLSLEATRPLPADWRGYLPDQRLLRALAAPPGLAAPSPRRDQYAAARLELESAAKSRALSAAESADLGALCVRLGSVDAALDVLRPAARRFPESFEVAANLGTALQLHGDLGQAAAALEEAARLAPPPLRGAERLHLALVRGRLNRAARGPAQLDALPGAGLAEVQQLAAWLPADGLLVWKLGELARERGELATAASLVDGAANEFGLDGPAFRARRQLFRQEARAAEERGAHAAPKPAGGFRSPRLLARGFDPARLPKPAPGAVPELPWAVVAETDYGPKALPVFLDYLDKLDGREVTLTGFVTLPAGLGADRLEEAREVLLTESPVGCWFCETPGPARTVLVELAAGERLEPGPNAVRVRGVVRLNRSEPDQYPVRLSDAKRLAVD